VVLPKPRERLVSVHGLEGRVCRWCRSAIISGVSIVASCCRTSSYSAIHVACFIDESLVKSVANGPGSITATLIPNAAAPARAFVPSRRLQTSFSRTLKESKIL
jgi:hypothetical protein